MSFKKKRYATSELPTELIVISWEIIKSLKLSPNQVE